MFRYQPFWPGRVVARPLPPSVAGGPAAVKGVSITLYNGPIPKASMSGLTVCWWDTITPHTWGAPDYAANTETTDGSGVLVVDLSADTALSIDDYGFLLIYKADGSNVDNSLVFAGQVQIQDIS
jgi:hypothetical protein